MSVKLLKNIRIPGILGFLSYIADTQGCGTIRCIYPYLLLNHLKLDKVKIISQFLSYYIKDVDFYKNISFIQFQRSATKEHLDIFSYHKNVVQKKFSAPIIYEIDDLLIDIPNWNFASEYYKKNEENVKRMLNMSNAVICSTEKLKELYSKYNDKIDVIPNHLPKFIWGDVYPKHLYDPREKRPKILWAGSANHFSVKQMHDKGIKGGDFSKELMNFIIKTTDKIEWCFMGALPQELSSIKNKISFYEWSPIFNYPQKLKEIDPDIFIAPLEDSIFNSCKSNIKMLEAIALGIPGVYSNVEPYKKAYLKCNTDEEIISNIEKLVDDVSFRSKVYKKDRTSIGLQLWWEEGNNLKNYVNTYLRLFGNKLP